jgi:hypothetical protein
MPRRRDLYFGASRRATDLFSRQARPISPCFARVRILRRLTNRCRQQQPRFAYWLSRPTCRAPVRAVVMSKATRQVLVAAPLILLLLAIAIPNFFKPRSLFSTNACANNLRWIDMAKKQWALEGHKTTNDVPTEAELLPFLGPKDHPSKVFPTCPSGGTYTIGRMDEPVKCSIGGIGHTLAAN